MSLIRTAIAALLYAALMTGWSAYEGEPFRGSYLLGFTFYAITFGVLFLAAIGLGHSGYGAVAAGALYW